MQDSLTMSPDVPPLVKQNTHSQLQSHNTFIISVSSAAFYSTPSGHTSPVSRGRSDCACPEGHHSSARPGRPHTTHSAAGPEHSRCSPPAHGTHCGHREGPPGLWSAVLGRWREYQHCGGQEIFLGGVLLCSGVLRDVWCCGG